MSVLNKEKLTVYSDAEHAMRSVSSEVRMQISGAEHAICHIMTYDVCTSIAHSHNIPADVYRHHH